MAKRGRKPKIWIDDFEKQQQMLLDKHRRGEELTQDEVRYLVGKDGKMPKSREDMVSKMSICKWEMAALAKMKAIICKSYPNWTEQQVRDAMIDVLNHRSSAKEVVVGATEY